MDYIDTDHGLVVQYNRAISWIGGDKTVYDEAHKAGHHYKGLMRAIEDLHYTTESLRRIVMETSHYLGVPKQDLLDEACKNVTYQRLLDDGNWCKQQRHHEAFSEDIDTSRYGIDQIAPLVINYTQAWIKIRDKRRNLG